MARLRKHRRRKGLALVETAIVLSLLLMLLLGIIEYAWVFVRFHQVSAAARHGARIGVRVDAKTADVEAAVLDLMQQAGLDAGYTVELSADPDSLTHGQTLTVTVDLPFRNNHDIVRIGMVPVPESLRAQVSMAREKV